MMEFAMVLPVILMIVLGIMDFGRMVFLYSQVSNAAREGARYGSVIGTGSTPQFIDCQGIRDASARLIPLPLVNFNPTTDVHITYDDGVNLRPFNCDSGPSEDLILQGDRVRVTVDAEMHFLTPVISAIRPSFDVSFTAARTVLRGGTQIPPADN